VAVEAAAAAEKAEEAAVYGIEDAPRSFGKKRGAKTENEAQQTRQGRKQAEGICEERKTPPLIGPRASSGCACAGKSLWPLSFF
jgi:hypothetical protein